MLNHLFLLAVISTHGATAPDKAIPFKVGELKEVSLQKSQKQDFTVALMKGSYRVILDTQGLDDEGKSVNCVQGCVKLMKQNGATDGALDYDFLSWYEFDAFHREVKVLNLKKNTAVRFRVQNSTLSLATNFLRVVPLTTGFVPFGFKAPVLEAKVGSEDGVGGSVDYLGYAYYRAKLPVGNWSISLGLRRPSGADSYLAGTMTLLDEQGKRLDIEPSKIDVTADTGRTEKILNVKKPRTVIIRVKNISNNHGALDYDVTVRKSTD